MFCISFGFLGINTYKALFNLTSSPTLSLLVIFPHLAVWLILEHCMCAPSSGHLHLIFFIWNIPFIDVYIASSLTYLGPLFKIHLFQWGFSWLSYLKFQCFFLLPFFIPFLCLFFSCALFSNMIFISLYLLFIYLFNEIYPHFI